MEIVRYIKILLIFFFGAIWGSFFYTLSLQYINGAFGKYKFKALLTSSKCPSCSQKINPLYLVPIIGYIILKGRCSKCRSKISKAYPLTEILYGIIAIVFYLKFGFNIYALNIFLLIGVAVSASLVDLRKLIIPNSLIIFFLALCIYPIILSNSIMDNIYGLLLMGVFFIIVLLIFPGSFGGGDVKLASSIGILLGFELSIVALEVSLISGSVAGIIYALTLKKGFKSKIPFAPFLAAGMFVSLLYGRDILLIYYRLAY